MSEQLESVWCPPPVNRWRRRRNYRAALNGTLPAEALTDRGDREQLVCELWQTGWRDVEIATHTQWSTYTVARIRERLGLAANPMVTVPEQHSA